MKDWVSDEFNELAFGDRRVNEKGRNIIRTLSKQPGVSIPQAFNTWVEIKSCYEFFASGKVTWQKILNPHQKATLERIKNERVVLLPTDTSSLNYTSKPSIKNLGHIANKNRGLWIHPLLAITPERVNLGLVDAKIWTRDEINTTLTSHEIYAKPIEEKEIYRWIESYKTGCEVAQECPETQVIMLTDREGDFAELFEEVNESRQKGKYADVIIRSAHDRSIEEMQNSQKTKLRDYLMSSPGIGEVTFTIPSTTGRPARTVTQTLKATEVTFKKRTVLKAKESPKVTINAVMAIEENPPAGAEPLIWVFLTTLPISTFEQVSLVIQYYLVRWEIETFFRVLKSGCKVEERRLEECESLLSMLAIFMIVAWRIMYAMRLGRESPEVSCEGVFSDAEWKSTWLVVNKKGELPDRAPTLGEFMKMIARLGGYIGRKNDPPPGPIVIWKGLSRVFDYSVAWETFNSLKKD